MARILFVLALILSYASAFSVASLSRHSFSLRATETQGDTDDVKNASVETFLEKKFPRFHQVMNDEMRKAIKEGAATIFCPNDAAFEALGDKKLQQIDDPRNAEIRKKVGSYLEA